MCQFKHLQNTCLLRIAVSKEGGSGLFKWRCGDKTSIVNWWWPSLFLCWEEFEDTKGIIRIHKSKDRQHNGQKDKQRSIKHYIKNWRSSNTNLTKTGGELMCSRRVSSFCSTRGTRHVKIQFSWKFFFFFVGFLSCY
jgi:hypothetical protein